MTAPAPRRPVFWFLWPQPDPNRPLDEAYVQTRWVRVAPRGPVRVAVLVLLTLGGVLVVAPAALAVLAADDGVTLLLNAVGAVVVFVVVVWLLQRAWQTGTYVHDGGARVVRMLTADTVPWSAVDAVHHGAGRARLLSLLWSVEAVRVDLVCSDGDVVRTDITSSSVDFLGRPEAFDMASLRLLRWWEDAPGRDQPAR